MPVFFQHPISETTRLGIWKIEESEEFFRGNVPQHRAVTHPHKRLQHLAGRFLLQFLFPDFPYALIQIAETRKPFLPDEQYHFSISHCGDYAAALVSTHYRVGIDIEKAGMRVEGMKQKFLGPEELRLFAGEEQFGVAGGAATLAWSAKEAVYKWYGEGSVDFRRHIQLRNLSTADSRIDCYFEKTHTWLEIHYRSFGPLFLAWVMG